MIMSGKKDAVLHQVNPYRHPWNPLLRHHFQPHRHAPDQPRRARIGVEDAYPDPRPGDAISVTYLMNVVTGIARR
jgi:hypothetical protein